MTTLSCHACRRGSLNPISDDLSDLGFITSDCRPWSAHGSLSICTSCALVQKPIDSEFRARAKAIYETYQSYSQSGGKEQSVFSSDGASKKRSEKLLDYLQVNANLQNTGTLLDFGCGEGNFLKAFNSLRPHWQLYGCDYGTNSREAIESIANTNFISEFVAEIHLKFDLIIASHVLEHIENPVSLLSLLRHRLAEGGKLLVQVPNLYQSPFDVLIADHCSHFSVQSLVNLISMSDFQLVALSDSVVPKELTAFLTPSSERRESESESEIIAKRHIDFLRRTKKQSVHATKTLGIFGSSIAGSWLFSQIPGIRFFVDEDPDRIGKSHLGIPIIAPADIPNGAVVLLPMNPRLAKSIESRLSSTRYELITPVDDD